MKNSCNSDNVIDMNSNGNIFYSEEIKNTELPQIFTLRLSEIKTQNSNQIKNNDDLLKYQVEKLKEVYFAETYG